MKQTNSAGSSNCVVSRRQMPDSTTTRTSREQRRSACSAIAVPRSPAAGINGKPRARHGADRRHSHPPPSVATGDSLRAYLTKINGTALLTREREVEIAKQIEQGQNDVAAAVLESPTASQGSPATDARS